MLNGTTGGRLGVRRLWVEEDGAPGPAGAIDLADVQGPEAELTYGLRRALAAVDPPGGVPPTEVAVLARSLGALFIRSYERGERVHLAMLSRGYDGRLPQ